MCFIKITGDHTGDRALRTEPKRAPPTTTGSPRASTGTRCANYRGGAPRFIRGAQPYFRARDVPVSGKCHRSAADRGLLGLDRPVLGLTALPGTRTTRRHPPAKPRNRLKALDATS